MISDGFGPASQTMARNFAQYSNNYSVGYQLPLDTILVGSSRTRSASSLVTDSAAGATAFSCMLKTYNGAIAVDVDGRPCGTVLEAAKELGFVTGLVATSRITHATPATFAAHVSSRAEESDIALQMIGNYSLGRRADLMFGGGSCFFKPKESPGSCRNDSIDVFSMARDIGWNVYQDKKEFEGQYTLPVLNLFAPDMMSYEIDRDPQIEPSLTEMSLKALDILNRASKERSTKFFIILGHEQTKSLLNQLWMCSVPGACIR
jgi:alkaline phosphatase